jgi:hypothetical protein
VLISLADNELDAGTVYVAGVADSNDIQSGHAESVQSEHATWPTCVLNLPVHVGVNSIMQ